MARFVVHTEHRQFPYNHKKSAEMVDKRFVALRISPIVRIERN